MRCKRIGCITEANDEVRARLEDEAAQYGWLHLHHQLALVDPPTAARIHAHDAQRIQRALEVYYLTGTSLSSLLAQQALACPYSFINLALFPPDRAWLHQRIALRFEQMVGVGLIEEVKTVQQQWQLTPDMPSMRCVGYRQAWDYLQGHDDYDSFLAKGIAATRQLAKRQLTWLRHWPDVIFYDPQSTMVQQEIIANIGEILDNKAL